MSQPSWVGQTLGGRYTIEAMLGQGGMSAVYRGTDPNLRRTVAIKLIHAHLTGDPEFVRRFEAEAAAVAQLRHPHIIQVYDFNHDGDTYFMVLEFVPGETLHSRLAKLAAQHQRMPANELIPIAASVAEAIDYAHQRGLIHRDIKPANVMINPQGQAVLMDFGIAKIMGSAAHTATGTVVGTAQYISPEQVRGQRPTERSDIYSLGVTMFEMAAGKPPFDGDSAMSIMLKHVNEPVPDLRALSPGVPPGLVAVIERTLAKEPADRYQTAGELAAALRQSGSAPVAYASATVIEPMPSGPPAGATVMEPAPGTQGSSPAPAYQPPPVAPPVQPPQQPLAQPPQQPPVQQPPPFTGYQPAQGGQSAAAASPPARRSPPVGLLIGVPLVLIVCIVLGVVGVLAATNLMGEDPTPTLAPTSPPTTVPATDVPTAAPTDPIAAEPTATEAVVEPTLEVVDPTAGMILIPAGEFQMGSSGPRADEQPLHTVSLNAFYLDQYEVTNGRYQVCVDEGACTPPAQTGSFTRSAYFGAPDFVDYPVVAVAWEQAVRFCAWDFGKRLPTEAEWEYAATGGDGRRYPWGPDFDGTLLPTTANDTVPVGSFPGGVSPFGVHDMAGNVLEWVTDYYDSLYYVESDSDNPQGPEFGEERVLRGGSFGNPDGQFYTTTRRYHFAPSTAEIDVGFRCALPQ